MNAGLMSPISGIVLIVKVTLAIAIYAVTTLWIIRTSENAGINYQRLTIKDQRLTIKDQRSMGVGNFLLLMVLVSM